MALELPAWLFCYGWFNQMLFISMGTACPALCRVRTLKGVTAYILECGISDIMEHILDDIFS